jgi:hypothetical protein
MLLGISVVIGLRCDLEEFAWYLASARYSEVMQGAEEKMI